jgi:hypothetical protein
MQGEEAECIGGGFAAEPARNTVRVETGGGKTGACAVCGKRLPLDSNGGIPRHKAPA